MPTAPAKPLVYLETSFISYLTARVSSDPILALDQAATESVILQSFTEFE